MALVTTTIAAQPHRTVFTKPPDLIRDQTIIPRALMNFALQEGTLDAKPVNDQQDLVVTVALDRAFAYRMVDFSISLTQDVAFDWTNRAYLEVENAVRGIPIDGQIQRHPITIEDVFKPAAAEQWIARFFSGEMPRYIMQAAAGAVGIKFRANNQTAAVGAAGTIDCLFTFFEYDLEQARQFIVHAPQLVYTR